MPSTSVSSSRSRSNPRAQLAQSALTASLHVECVDDLSQSLVDTWHRFQGSNPALANGCFHFEFADAVSRVRTGVEYAIIRQNSEVAGIFPFQRSGSRVIKPVGGMMNDFHGLITNAATKIDLAEVLKQIDVRKFDFHALSLDALNQKTTLQSNRTKRVFRELNCPFIDLSDGSLAYRDWLLKHSSTVRRQPQKTRALSRRHGPIRMEIDCRDPAMLEKVIEWKRAKFRRTRTFDLLGVEWTSNLLRELFRTRTDGFKGLLSILWAGDQPVSGHFGFQSGSLLHYYIPAHNIQFRQFSPGTELMYQMACSGPQHGIKRIDFGYGESDLKDRFANNRTSVQRGCIGFNPLSRLLSHGRYEVRQALKQMPLKEPLKKIVRPLHPNLGIHKFR